MIVYIPNALLLNKTIQTSFTGMLSVTYYFFTTDYTKYSHEFSINIILILVMNSI